MKIAVRLIAGLVVIIVVAVVVVIMQGGAIIRNAVESYGPEFTGGPIALDNVDYSLFDGEAWLEGFVIGNPEGFESEHAFSLGRVYLKLDPMSVFSDHVKIHEIRIEEPDLNVEVTGGGTNLAAIQGNLSADAAEESSTESAVNVTIDHVYITDGTIQVLGPVSLAETPTVALPDIHLEGIGAEEEGGTDMASALQEVMGAVVPAATKAVMDLNLKGLTGDLLGEGESLKDKIGGAIGGLLGKKKDPEN